MALTVKGVVVTVKTTSFALSPMARVQPVSQAGMVRNATAHVHLVSMVMAAKKSVHDAGIMNPVTQKLGCVRAVIPDGLDPGVRTAALTGGLETPAS